MQEKDQKPAYKPEGRFFVPHHSPVMGFPGGSVEKNLPANAGDMGSILGLGRSPGEGNGNPLQCSCLGNPMDRRAWGTPGVTKSQT